jgi:hypothetical protein
MVHHLPEHDLTATILPFVERFNGTPLGDRGIDPAAVFPLPPLARSMQAAFRPVQPAGIAGIVYTRLHWGRSVAPYDDLDAGVDSVLQTAGETAATTPP